jgi:Na+/proline symporter
MGIYTLIFVLTIPARETSDPITMPSVFTVNATLGEVLLFWGWIAVLNFTLPFTQLSSWQRLAATTSVSEAWKGLLRTIPAFLTVWLIPVFAFVLLATKGYTIQDLSGLFMPDS